MQVPYFRAKDKDSCHYYNGFYFEYPATTFCFTEDYESNKCRNIHCLVTYRTEDWGLPNTPQLVTIDINTLEKIGNVDIGSEFFHEKIIHKLP